MEIINNINQQYSQINEKLCNLDEVIIDVEKQGMSDVHMKSLEDLTLFVDRDIKSQLKKEEETLSSMKRQIGEHRSKDIQEAIQEHDVLYGALDQFVYGVKMQSEPDIMESAKSILDHFPAHFNKVDTIMKNKQELLQ